MTVKYNPREILAAAPDTISMGVGEKVSHPHPLAGDLSLRNIAYACGIIQRPQQAFEDDRTVVARGMSTSDFSRVLADGVKSVTIAAYGAQAEHMAFAVPQEVQNFRPVAIPSLEGDIVLELLGEHAEISHFYALLNGGATKVALTTFGRLVNISREAILNNQVTDFGRLFAAFGGSGARLESRMVAATLEANPLLDDGGATFDAAYSNVLAQSLDADGLGLAMALLRTQPTASGQRADLRAKHLVVAPALERIARELVRTAGLDLTVSVLAALPDGRWYLLADPVVCPTVGVLRLFGVKTPVRVESARRPLQMEGACVKVTADVGACILRRTGIVRAGA